MKEGEFAEKAIVKKEKARMLKKRKRGDGVFPAHARPGERKCIARGREDPLRGGKGSHLKG